jgi:hypothetical protein
MARHGIKELSVRVVVEMFPALFSIQSRHPRPQRRLLHRGGQVRPRGEWLLSTFENVSVFLKALQVRLEQVKRPFGIPRIDARSPQTDYAAFLLLYDAPPLGAEFLGAPKIVFGIHLSK